MMYLSPMVLALLAVNLVSVRTAWALRSLRQETYSHHGQKVLHEKEALSGGNLNQLHREGGEGKGHSSALWGETTTLSGISDDIGIVNLMLNGLCFDARGIAMEGCIRYDREDIVVTAGSTSTVWGCPLHFKEAPDHGSRINFEVGDLKMNDVDIWVNRAFTIPENRKCDYQAVIGVTDPCIPTDQSLITNWGSHSRANDVDCYNRPCKYDANPAKSEKRVMGIPGGCSAQSGHLRIYKGCSGLLFEVEIWAHDYNVNPNKNYYAMEKNMGKSPS
jgi:hypothetical protein